MALRADRARPADVPRRRIVLWRRLKRNAGVTSTLRAIVCKSVEVSGSPATEIVTS